MCRRIGSHEVLSTIVCLEVQKVSVNRAWCLESLCGTLPTSRPAPTATFNFTLAIICSRSSILFPDTLTSLFYNVAFPDNRHCPWRKHRGSLFYIEETPVKNQEYGAISQVSNTLRTFKMRKAASERSSGVDGDPCLQKLKCIMKVQKFSGVRDNILFSFAVFRQVVLGKMIYHYARNVQIWCSRCGSSVSYLWDMTECRENAIVRQNGHKWVKLLPFPPSDTLLAK